MRSALAILLYVLTLPATGHAGAWMRENGESFLSVSVALRHSAIGTGREVDVYFDHGFAPRLSGGLAVFEDSGRSGHVMGFLRFPLPTRDRSHLGLELALGVYHQQGTIGPVYKEGAAWGRGFRWGSGEGWFNVEAAFEHRIGQPEPFLKLDATIGRSTGARLRPMVKANATHIDGQPLIWSVAANLMIDTRRDMTWIVGLERKQAGGSSTALNIGIWRRF